MDDWSIDKILEMFTDEDYDVIDKLLMEGIEKYPEDKLPNTVYHYTSTIGMKGILNDNSIWLTHYKYLNDSSEREYTYRLLRECLEKNSKKNDREFYEEAMKCIYDKDILKTRRVYKGLYQLKDYYVASFSRSKDSLSLWNYYTKNVDKTGYNIRFKLPLLKEALKGKKVIAYKVIYDVKKQKERLFLLINAFNTAWHSKCEDYFSKLLMSLFVEIVDGISMYFKHPAFREEQEVRLIYEDTNEDNCEYKFREMSGIMVPYIEMKFNPKCVEGIGISPTQRDELACEGIYKFLQYKGYLHVKRNDIVISSIPLKY